MHQQGKSKKEKKIFFFGLWRSVPFVERNTAHNYSLEISLLLHVNTERLTNSTIWMTAPWHRRNNFPFALARSLFLSRNVLWVSKFGVVLRIRAPTHSRCFFCVAADAASDTVAVVVVVAVAFVSVVPVRAIFMQYLLLFISFVDRDFHNDSRAVCLRRCLWLPRACVCVWASPLITSNQTSIHISSTLQAYYSRPSRIDISYEFVGIKRAARSQYTRNK